jgi:SAM-dependent methyltransferase
VDKLVPVTDPVIDLFDRVADDYDAVVPFFAAFGALTVAKLPPPRPGDRLLDVGAGAGAIALAARERGYQVSAVDASAAMVARLGAELPDVRVADAAALPYAEAGFDVVTAGFVLHILSDPAAALAEIRRVLRPGGLVAFTVVGPPPPDFEPDDSAGALFAEFARYLPPGGSMGAPFDAPAILDRLGFIDVTGEHLRVELPLAGPETMWRWIESHGTRKFVDDLPPERRAELRDRIIADLSGRDPLVLRRTALLYTASVTPGGAPRS